MKRLTISILLCGAAVSCLAQGRFAERTGRGFVERFPDPHTIHWQGGDNFFSWQSGYVMYAMEKLWRQTRQQRYFDYIRKFVDQNVDAEGNVPLFTARDLDNFLPGSAILFMYEQTGEARYAKAAERIRRGFDTYPRLDNKMFYHGRNTRQTWVDGVFMGQIFLARYAKTMNHPEDFAEVVRQITGIVSLCDNGNGLLYHMWDANGHSSCIWSEGMGWTAVLLADVLDYLPEDCPGRDKVMEALRRMCKGLKDCQDPDTGMWCQVVDCPQAPGNWNETSGTGMFLYLIQKSILKGYVPAAEYQGVVDRAYRGITKKAVFNADSFVNLLDCSSIGVQRDYKAYISQPREISTFAAYGSFIIGTGAVEFDARQKR